MKRAMLITGASAGIGAAVARLAARGGWDVGVGYNSDEQGAHAVVGSVERAGGRAAALQADVGDPGAVAGMFARFEAEIGRMAAFVNNAGVVMPASRFEDISAERLETIFRINQIGAFETWRRYDADRQSMIGGQLERIAGTRNLSKDTNEIVGKMLGAG